jgi:hypothetical protein
MAMRILRTILLCAAVLFLGSCEVLQFIFGSVFPTTLMLAKAQVKVEGIDSGFGQSFAVRVVEAGGYGYVVVEGSTPLSGNSIFFYDLDLNLKLSLTGATAPAGAGVMADSNGKINAGGTLLNADLTVPTPGSPNVSNNGSMGNDGFVADNAGTLYNITGIYCPGGTNTLSYMRYTAAWAGGTTYTPALSFSMFNLRIDAVLDDGNPAGSAVIVVSEGNGNEDDVTRYFVTLSKFDLANGTAPGYLLDTAPARDQIERDSLGFADGAIIAYDKGSSRFLRIDPANGTIKKSLYSVGQKDVRYAYRASGGEFYGFNMKTLVLTKYTAWW